MTLLAPRPRTRPRLTRPGRPHPALGLLLALAATVLVQLAAAHFPFAEPTRTDAVAATTTTAATLTALAWLTLRDRAPLAAYPLLAALPTFLLALPLHGTPLYLGGLASDNQFRVQYVTRYAAEAALSDVNYADLPPLYPPAWFWLAGRAASHVGIEGWAAYKPAAITSIALTTALAHALWSRLTGHRLAVALAVATLLAAFHAPAFAALEPYAWLVAAVMPPLAVLAHRALTAPRTPYRTLVLCGLYLGLATLTYTLLAAFWAFALVVMALTLIPGNPRRTRTLLTRLALVAATATPLALITWGPYLAAALPAGMPRNNALRFIPVQQTSFPLPMTELTLTGLLCLAGTLWLLTHARRTSTPGAPTARALLTLAAACYLWSLLSQLAVVLGPSSLLSFRVHPVLFATLFCAGVLAVAELTARMHTKGYVRPVAATVTATVCALALVQQAPRDLRQEFDAAYGPRPPRALIDTIAELTGGARPQDLTVLTDQHRLLSAAPYRGYLTAEPVYSHPLADFAGRTEEVRSWAQPASPAAFEARLAHGPYDPPQVFVLRRAPGAYALTLGRDNFPHQPNRVGLPVRLPAALFDAGRFAREDVGPYTVLVHRPVPPSRTQGSDPSVGER
ncbi:arabinofuranosyltransferase [Streptomyces sp. NPDC050418]|uniref:arabinofuranosyltransferase n=1 Tax=Streptomyces sp. NPDC050418 TaxID=3365612 RepID=UPI0037A79C4D